VYPVIRKHGINVAGEKIMPELMHTVETACTVKHKRQALFRAFRMSPRFLLALDATTWRVGAFVARSYSPASPNALATTKAPMSVDSKVDASIVDIPCEIIFS
jgi:hypothetical protein